MMQHKTSGLAQHRREADEIEMSKLQQNEATGNKFQEKCVHMYREMSDLWSACRNGNLLLEEIFEILIFDVD